MRKLTDRQRSCLKGMVTYTSDGTWSRDAGWLHDTFSGTLRTMRQLELRKLVAAEWVDDSYLLFTITDAGRAEVT